VPPLSPYTTLFRSRHRHHRSGYVDPAGQARLLRDASLAAYVAGYLDRRRIPGGGQAKLHRNRLVYYDFHWRLFLRQTSHTLYLGLRAVCVADCDYPRRRVGIVSRDDEQKQPWVAAATPP